MTKLTPKQERFVTEYLVDLNATQAAIRSGYSKHTAEQQGSRLLRNAQISAVVAASRQKLAQKREITIESIAQELALLGFARMGDYVDDKQQLRPVTYEQTAAIAEIRVAKNGERKVKLHDKRAALVDLGKYLGMFDAPGSSPENPLHIAEAPLSQKVAAIALMIAREARQGKVIDGAKVEEKLE